MTPLEIEIRSMIESEGPLSIADYMTVCLTHPRHGYYTTGHPLGGRATADRSGGDFITAPEVSQMFGELLGVWCMEMWQALGEPKRFSLVECGPGRGTLMRDLLRISDALPAFRNAAEVHLVEISPTLAERQSALLSSCHHTIRWISDLADLPDQPILLIGNEFLDALPFRQWVRSGTGWIERAVGLVEDKLAFVTKPALLPLEDAPALPAKDGAIFETAPAREAFVERLAGMLMARSGAVLLIDYGHTRPGIGDTFQAVRDHGFADPLSMPGECDLTSHVDFAALVKRAQDAGCSGPPLTTQGEFLLALGLLERAGHLGSGRDEQVQNSLRSAVERLAGPDQMGDLFKVLAFGHPAALRERWPGFA